MYPILGASSFTASQAGLAISIGEKSDLALVLSRPILKATFTFCGRRGCCVPVAMPSVPSFPRMPFREQQSMRHDIHATHGLSVLTTLLAAKWFRLPILNLSGDAALSFTVFFFRHRNVPTRLKLLTYHTMNEHVSMTWKLSCIPSLKQDLVTSVVMFETMTWKRRKATTTTLSTARMDDRCTVQ